MNSLFVTIVGGLFIFVTVIGKEKDCDITKNKSTRTSGSGTLSLILNYSSDPGWIADTAMSVASMY